MPFTVLGVEFFEVIKITQDSKGLPMTIFFHSDFLLGQIEAIFIYVYLIKFKV